MNDAQHEEAGMGSYLSYSIGFLTSLELTLGAYLLVIHHSFTSGRLILAIIGLAIAQLLVQLVFFLHLGRESKPRWNLVVFSFALIVVLIVVIGSLWIMNHLNYHNMTPQQTNTFIIKDEGIQP
jgi:cytochrome o ubiquinol oxidase subunit IV